MRNEKYPVYFSREAFDYRMERTVADRLAAPAHLIEELDIGLGGLHLLKHQFH